MSKVCCAGCREYHDKEDMLAFGLGWCCDVDCRSAAIQHRREKARATAVVPAEERKERNPSQVTRGRVRDRDGGRCRFCGTTKNLSIHHVRYRSEGGGHTERNLLTLCIHDHSIVHSNKRYWQPILLELLRQQYDNARFMTVPETVNILEQENDLGEKG